MFKACQNHIGYISRRLVFPQVLTCKFDVNFVPSTLVGQVAVLASSPPGAAGARWCFKETPLHESTAKAHTKGRAHIGGIGSGLNTKAI